MKVIELGNHRLIQGDSRDSGILHELMQGEKAHLVIADPPYGMGKKSIANDNIYKNKLADFQTQWWENCKPHLKDNASAYVWGEARELWRWWYNYLEGTGVYFRNELVWVKNNAIGVKSEGIKSYPPETERCLFFMLDFSGYSTNSDNYWEGWEPIRSYLEEQRLIAKWDIPKMKEIAGHSIKSLDHWTSKSQWSMPTEKVYTTMQNYCRENGIGAFLRDYSELKEDYRNKRSYFNNSLGLTDILRFPPVWNEERLGHDTPKPVEMLEKLILSSTREGDIVLDPFSGTGSVLIACENTGRRCRAIELIPKWCEVIDKRWNKLVDNKRVPLF